MPSASEERNDLNLDPCRHLDLGGAELSVRSDRLGTAEKSEKSQEHSTNASSKVHTFASL